MANRHASHPASSHSASASESADGRVPRGRFPVTGAAPPARRLVHRLVPRLGGVLRWDEADGVGRMLRRGVALSMAALLGLLPMMQTAAAAERTAATAERTHLAALAPIRLPL